MKARHLVALAGMAIFALANPGRSDAFQSLKVQRAITLIVNVQAPVAFAPFGLPGIGIGSSAAFASLPQSAPVLVAGTQGSAKVNANVIADPNAGLLVLNKTTYSMTQTSGTTVTYSCAFTFQVGEPSTTTWSVDDGLASDFGSGFPAADVAWTTYASPGPVSATPTWTNYINYYTNNNAWQLTAHATGTVTNCIDLRVAVPAGLTPGQYSATAVYSLYA